MASGDSTTTLPAPRFSETAPTRRALCSLLLVLATACSDAGGESGASTPEGATASRDDVARWEEFTASSGVDFVHTTGAVGDKQLPEIMGGGVALFDADGDADLDLFLTNGGTAADRFYRQVAPGRFEDATAESGLGGTEFGMGVAVGDVDNDGDLDLYVTNYGRDRLYRNRGDGTFEDGTRAAGLTAEDWSSSALFLDYDRDGYLDLFVVRYIAFDPEEECFDKTGRRDYCGPLAMPPVSDQLFRNQRDGTFRDVSREAGFSAHAAAGLGVVAEDFDRDGWPDLAVANDAYANQLWINQRDGTFEELALPLGLAFNQHGQAEAGMGIVAGDLDGDDSIDVFLTHLDAETNTIYRGAGRAGFRDVTGASGLARSSMPFTGFGIAAFDAEQDGDLDLLVANGRVVLGKVDVPDDPWATFAERNQAFVNDGTGGFRELVDDPPFTSHVEISRGLAMGDLDQDGDIDVVLANVEGPARLFRNVHPQAGHWLRVRAVDPALGRDAIGAEVSVVSGEARWRRTVHGQGGYLSSSDLVAHFGLGSNVRFDRIEVRWPDGLLETFAGGAADRTVELARGTGTEVR